MFNFRFGSVLCATLCGCASPSPVSTHSIDSVSEPRFLADLGSIDAIQIGTLSLTEPSDISRFIEVCSNANWAPYIATMPAKIETVEFISNGTVSRKLLYAGGMLFETANDRTTRFAEIDQADKAWLEGNIARALKQLRRGQDVD